MREYYVVVKYNGKVVGTFDNIYSIEEAETLAEEMAEYFETECEFETKEAA